MAEIVTIVDGVTYQLSDLPNASISDLTWSHAWPYGCYEASWSINLPPNTSPKALRAGAWVEIWDGPIRCWCGYISEPAPGLPWTINAKGWYAALGDRLALDATPKPTSVPQTALEQAIARGTGLPITIGTPLSSTAFSSADETVDFNYMLAFLDAVATAEGKRWMVDANYVFTMATDPTDISYVHDSPDPLRGTADDDYVTDVYPRFVTSLDVDGNPDGWGLGHVGTPSQPAGRRERGMDLKDLGVLTGGLTEADGYGQAQLNLNGARMGYTSGLEVRYGQLLRPGGSPVRLGLVTAREMFRSFNVADASGQVQLGMTADVVIGRSVYVDGDDRLRVDPVGLAPRTFVDTMQAIKPKDTYRGSAA